MKIYLLIKPWDYTFAEVEIYYTKESATTTKTHARQTKEKNSENWVIREEEI